MYFLTKSIYVIRYLLVMIRKVIIGLMCFGLSVSAQVNTAGLEDFNKAAYTALEDQNDRDVTIIFDRTYIDVKKNRITEVYKTVHRKIKIHSLYGLEHYNKLYIPTLNSFNSKLDFVDCKAKTLKKAKGVVATKIESMVTTTLPANAPFFYKIEGEVKMLAIKDVNVGDEIEYIFTTKRTYDYSVSFYKAGKINYGANDYCLEKSLFINANKLNVSIWPYNFHNGLNRNSDFTHSHGYKVSLNNIKPNLAELYAQDNLNAPYVFYEIRTGANEALNTTWKGFAKYFKPRRLDTRRNYILNGQTLSEALEEFDTIGSVKETYKSILNNINRPIENNFHVYEDVRDDIDVAWSYAKVISKAVKKLKLPINFHFVVSKASGEFDKSLVNLYQFNTIICSFKNEAGKLEYFPLLEPYSTLNDIRKEYQQTACFTIKQDANGNRTHEFGEIPLLEEGAFQKKVHLTLKKITSDTLKVAVKATLKFSGHSWLEVKPLVSYILNDTTNTKKRIKTFVKNQVVLRQNIDSIYNIRYSKKDNVFTVDYTYDFLKQINTNASYFNINPRQFFENDFFTPYYLKDKRLNKGYFTNEYDTNYLFSIESTNVWQENKSLKRDVDNAFGTVNATYNYNGNTLETAIKLHLKKVEFEPLDWDKVLDLRTHVYDFLNSKFYFKI